VWIPEKDTPRETKRRSYIALCAVAIVILSMIRMVVLPAFGFTIHPVPNILWGGVVIFVVHGAFNILLSADKVSDKDYRLFIGFVAVFVINMILAASGVYK
jgi:hypothetical protein